MSTLYVDNLEPNLGSRVMAAGHVVQVVGGNLNSLATTSTTLASMGSVSITPAATSSRILIFYVNHIYLNSATTTEEWRAGLVTLKRNSTIIQEDTLSQYGQSESSVDIRDRSMDYSSKQYFDTPNTTSEITYEVFGRSLSGSDVRFNNPSFGTGGRITLMEIAQ